MFHPLEIKKSSSVFLPVASGKGGAGKTFFSINLAIALAKQNKKVILVDLDLGAANVHTCMGIKSSPLNLSQYLQQGRNAKSMDNFLINTGVNNLKLLQGDQNLVDLANTSQNTRKKIIKGLCQLKADYILLDLGAGTHPNVVDFFLLSQKGLVLSQPNHASVLNSYAFLKNCVYRLFQFYMTTPAHKRILNRIKKSDQLGKYPTFWNILNDVANQDKKLALKLRRKLEKFQPSLIFNRMESTNDMPLVQLLVESVYNKLVLDLDMLGYIPEDEDVHQSMKQRLPLLLSGADKLPVDNLLKMAQRIGNHFQNDQPLFDVENYQSGFDEMEIDIAEQERIALEEAIADERARRKSA